MKKIAVLQFRSWFKSIVIPQNDEYLDFLRSYDFSVDRILDLLDHFIHAAKQTRTLKALNLEERNTEYDRYIVFLFGQLGDALDLEFVKSSEQLAAKLDSQEIIRRILSILKGAENLEKIQSSCKNELDLLKEIGAPLTRTQNT